MKNNFFAILLSLIISIGCTQETVINANIDEKLNNSGPTLKVQIKTENSRTIRPEVTKWEIKLFELNGTNEEILATRVLHGKDNTVTTFTNITTTEYKIKVYGYAVENDKDCKILFGEKDVEITSNETEMCVVTVNDNFETQSSENPSGTLSVNISGLEALQLDVFEAKFTLKLTTLSINDGNTVDEKKVDLVYESGKLSVKDDSIPVGSYKIEKISAILNDSGASPTGEVGDSAAIDVLPINLIQDPIVNIYPGVTTEINWVWNVIEDTVDEITQNNMLKNTLVPVWNKPVVLNPDYPEKPSVPAKNGYLSANALFAEPTWQDGEESYNFEYTHEDEGIISATVNKDELEFINCTYDESGNLWVLSGTSGTKEFFDDNNSVLDQEYYCYVLRNLSASETKEYKFTCSSRLSQDFAVATVGEQNDQNKQKYLLCITDTEDGNNIKSFKIEGEGGDLDDGTSYCSYGGDQYITAIYAKGDQLYIAITENNNYTTANIYTGIINEKGELASFGEDNQPAPILSLGISDFTNGTIQNDYFNNSAFMISDMYINEDKTKLYVTAGCVSYQGNAWNNQQGRRVYHSFGGLFVYNVKEDGSLEFSNKYGIYEDNDENNPFLKEAETAGGEGIFELEENIMQAENEKSPYFAGPRYIIPAGKDLLIVDSGFYGVYKDLNTPLTDCEKRNRIFTYNIIENELLFNSITKVDDSISFDYDYLVNSYKIE